MQPGFLALRQIFRDTRINDLPVKKTEHIPELIYDDSFSQISETDYWSQ
jgi:hypothetical protein